MAHPPKCKLCGVAHWSWQPHKWPSVIPGRVDAFVEPVTQTRNTEKPVTEAVLVCLADVEPSHRCKRCRKGIQKPMRGPWPEFCSAACRQAAYRGRK